ncbi:cytochrome c oxidase subunit 8A, mitochondrial [Petaurus breviceps papuanus]|uniref:cytochrome c oxidase subunit 8A, mitochondrial n=1 Tax=Petaurus breviceps papuanus TaxID=3040969 RepID=UPI0036DF0A6D
MGGGSSISIHKAKGEDGSFPEKSLLKWRSPRAFGSPTGVLPGCRPSSSDAPQWLSRREREGRSGGRRVVPEASVTCPSHRRDVGSDPLGGGSGCRPAWDWFLRGAGALGPCAASSPPLRQRGSWPGPRKVPGRGSWKRVTGRPQSTPLPPRLLRRLQTFATSSAAAEATSPKTMPWRHLSALFRHRPTRGSPPGTGSGRRLEHNDFVEYTEATEGQTGPAEPVNASETAFALVVFFSAHLIPCGWVLSHMETYRRV